MTKDTAKPLVIAVTGCTAVFTLTAWFITMMEFDQLSHHGQQAPSLPAFAHVLHALYHFSGILPLSAAVLGWRLLSADQPADRDVSRYCSCFLLATSLWAFIVIIGLYSLHAMRHHCL